MTSERSRTARTLLAVSLTVCLIVAAAWPASPAGALEFPSGSLVLAGCGSNAPILRLLAKAFRQHEDVALHIQAIGSTTGIWAAAAGAIPVGLVSRPLRESETTLGLSVVPYARTALVLAAHLGVADDDLTTRELLAIYRGVQYRWRSGHDLVLLTREEGDTSIQLLTGNDPGFRQAYAEGLRIPRQMVMYSEAQMHRTLANTPLALGLSDLGTLTIERLSLKALTVNGVPPTLEHLASGRYPFAKTLAFVFRPEKLPPELQRFLAFVQSPEGHRILTAHGYLPVQP